MVICNLPHGFGGGKLSQQAMRGEEREGAVRTDPQRSVWDYTGHLWDTFQV